MKLTPNEEALQGRLLHARALLADLINAIESGAALREPIAAGRAFCQAETAIETRKAAAQEEL